MAQISPKQYEEYRQKLKQMRMMDDTLMKSVFKDCKPAVELVLRIILQRDDLEVKSFSTGKEYENENINGLSVCLDVLAEDKDGEQYCVEIIKANKGVTPKQARICSSKMLVEMLLEEGDFPDHKESYTIFITEDDIFKGGDALYPFDRFDEKNNIRLGDGTHIIYVNGAYTGDDPLGWLMSDFREPDPEKMHYKVLAERVNCLKNDSEGEKEMCKIMEELVEKRAKKELQKGIQKGRLEGIQKGRLEGIQISVRLCRQFGLSDEQIVEQIATEYHLSKKEAAQYVYSD